MEDTLTPSDHPWTGLSPLDTDSQSRISEATFFFPSQTDYVDFPELSITSPSHIEPASHDTNGVPLPQMQFPSRSETPVSPSRTEPSAPLIRSEVRSRLRAPIWSLGTRTQDLLYDLTEEWALQLASRCADLPGSGAFNRIPYTEYYFPPPLLHKVTSDPLPSAGLAFDSSSRRLQYLYGLAWS